MLDSPADRCDPGPELARRGRGTQLPGLPACLGVARAVRCSGCRAAASLSAFPAVTRTALCLATVTRTSRVGHRSRRAAELEHELRVSLRSSLARPGLQQSEPTAPPRPLRLFHRHRAAGVTGRAVTRTRMLPSRPRMRAGRASLSAGALGGARFVGRHVPLPGAREPPATPTAIGRHWHPARPRRQFRGQPE